MAAYSNHLAKMTEATWYPFDSMIGLNSPDSSRNGRLEIFSIFLCCLSFQRANDG